MFIHNAFGEDVCIKLFQTSLSLLFFPMFLNVFLLCFCVFVSQAEELTADRFVVYEDHYVDIREAMARTALATNDNELTTALKVRSVSCTFNRFCVW